MNQKTLVSLVGMSAMLASVLSFAPAANAYPYGGFCRVQPPCHERWELRRQRAALRYERNHRFMFCHRPLIRLF